jgi:hypothetical protein
MATAPGGLVGTGLVPGGAIGNELAAITRRAFIPRLIVQLYKATPFLYMLLKGAQRAKGGVGNITVPVQGNSMVTAEWTDFGGSFSQPADITGIQNAAMNLTVSVVPIPFFGMESLIQSSEVVIPRLKTKMADAKQVMLQLFSNALFTNNTSATTMSGLPQAFDDGTLVGTYANITRSTNTFWNSTKISAGNVLTRSAFVKYIPQLTSLAGGESPDFIIMSLSDWTTLMQDFMTAESFRTMPGDRYGRDTPINAGFRCLMLGDTPIIADLYCPKGTAYLINTKYYNLYLSEDAPFAFSGFYSTIPNLQIANIGVLVTALQTICTKPVSGMQLTGITGGAF